MISVISINCHKKLYASFVCNTDSKRSPIDSSVPLPNLRFGRWPLRDHWLFETKNLCCFLQTLTPSVDCTCVHERTYPPSFHVKFQNQLMFLDFVGIIGIGGGLTGICDVLLDAAQLLGNRHTYQRLSIFLNIQGYFSITNQEGKVE